MTALLKTIAMSADLQPAVTDVIGVRHICRNTQTTYCTTQQRLCAHHGAMSMETNPGTRLGVLETWILGLKKRIADRTSVSGPIRTAVFIADTGNICRKVRRIKKNRIAAQSFLHFPVSHG
jgi:hypothetical protein